MLAHVFTVSKPVFTLVTGAFGFCSVVSQPRDRMSRKHAEELTYECVFESQERAVPIPDPFICVDDDGREILIQIVICDTLSKDHT